MLGPPLGVIAVSQSMVAGRCAVTAALTWVYSVGPVTLPMTTSSTLPALDASTVTERTPVCGTRVRSAACQATACWTSSPVRRAPLALGEVVMAVSVRR